MSGWMLIAATSRGDLHESRRLIEEEDVDVNEADAMGQTPLHLAAYHGHKDLVKYLINKGANIDAETNDGLTPQALAEEVEEQDTAALLKRARKKAFIAQMFIYAAKGDVSGVKTLVEDKGIKIDITDQSGQTPLHVAAMNGQKDLVEFLLNKGANPEVQSKDGLTPLNLAMMSADVDTSRLLETTLERVQQPPPVGSSTITTRLARMSKPIVSAAPAPETKKADAVVIATAKARERVRQQLEVDEPTPTDASGRRLSSNSNSAVRRPRHRHHHSNGGNKAPVDVSNAKPKGSQSEPFLPRLPGAKSDAGSRREEAPVSVAATVGGPQQQPRNDEGAGHQWKPFRARMSNGGTNNVSTRNNGYSRNLAPIPDEQRAVPARYGRESAAAAVAPTRRLLAPLAS